MSTYLRLIGYLGPYRGRFVVAMVLISLAIVGDLLGPWLFGLTIDKGLASGNMRLVLFYASLLVLAQALRSVSNYIQWLYQHRTGQNVVRDLRNEMYTKLQALPQSFYRGMPTGQIMSRLTSDVEAVQEYLGWGLLIQFAAILSLIGTSAALMVVDARLTMVLLLPIIPLAVIVFFFDKNVGPAWEKVRDQMGHLTTVLQENISGVRVVKAFAKEGFEKKKFDDENQKNKRLGLKRANIEANAFPSMDLMIGLTFVLLAWYGGMRVMRGETTLGTFFAYQWYLWGIIWPVRFGGWIISTMREAMSAAPRIFEVLDAPLTIADKPDATALPTIQGEITFRDVTFSFDDQPDKLVLQGLNFHVAPGEIVALMGATGSGKSSLINLLLRFQAVNEGQVLVDGHDVCDVTLDSLRGQMAVVPQESFLFSASVSNNIAYGRPGATMEEVIAAAKLAQAHDFVMELEKGYDSLVGERGIGLSGGQKQRLALARAILMDPRILILDEAMSAVDTETEHEIQQALEQVMQGRTSLIIAQRLSTIKHADRIVVLKEGRVAESGTHAALLASNGEYARIYNLQYREQDEREQAALERLMHHRAQQATPVLTSA